MIVGFKYCSLSLNIFLVSDGRVVPERIWLWDVVCCVQAEAPMNWVPRRRAPVNGCPQEEKTCVMKGRYSTPNTTKTRNTNPKQNVKRCGINISKMLRDGLVREL